MREPRLRNVEKYRPPFPINQFPEDFALGLGREVVCHLATRTAPILEGTDWEQIFARLIGARWKPSNVGLDDVVLEQTAWGAKTVKSTNPSLANRVRLISGRNSPVYSYGDREVSECDPDILGEKVLEIWNERVAAIKRNYRHLRTIVLLKAEDLLELSAFEKDTVMYDVSGFEWRWNKRNNLEGFSRREARHQFTWQPHGSQFTIIEEVPEERVSIRIKPPPPLDPQDILNSLGFDESWVEVL